MRIPITQLVAPSLLLSMGLLVAGGSAWAQSNDLQQQAPLVSANLPALQTRVDPSLEHLPAFKDSDVKFDLQNLMNMLKDHRHEGWVLHAYPDPTTHRPLIGAGFSLDLPYRDHAQQDAINPHPFFELSSAELWQAAGLDPVRLQAILAQFNDQPVVPMKRKSRRKRKALPPQITDEDAERLLRVAVIQAIDNAKAYCRDFDSLTASQQMAMTQLVYQMGVNLEEFNQFLTVINDDSSSTLLILGPALVETVRWDWARTALIQSQWARLYRDRAVSVIAMFDPLYITDPVAAESRVSSFLPPIVVQRPKRRTRGSLRNVSSGRFPARSARKRAGRDRKAT